MEKARFGVVEFPGSNCDHDAYHTIKQVLGHPVEFLWHKDADLKNSDVVILPGGFSYGDYLRCGSIARFSPIMREVIDFAHAGGAVIGICNGFQILTEAGLLPGTLLRNESLRFVCRQVTLRVENAESMFTSAYAPGALVRVPVAHGEGNYYADAATIRALEDGNRVAFRYVDALGNATPDSNPNGSVNNIAGILNETGNVLGMMPHPERSVEVLLGSTDGLRVFQSLVNTVLERSHIYA